MFRNLMSKIKKTYNSFPLVVHPLFLCLGVYCIFMKIFDVFLCYILSALLHEMGHFIVAKKLGYKMLQVRVMPYGAELCGEIDEFLYSDDIKIAIAGPITSLLLAGVVVCFWWIFPNCYEWTYEFCVSNIVCAIFNILPVYPLDGGRVLVSYLSRNLARNDALRYAKNATKVFSYLMFGLFLLSIFYTLNITFGIIAIMLYSSTFNNFKECSYVRLTKTSLRYKEMKRGVEVVELMVDEKTKISKIYSKLKSQKFYRFIVVDKNLSVKAVVDEKMFAEIEPENFMLTFEEILLLKYNKNMCLTR